MRDWIWLVLAMVAAGLVLRWFARYMRRPHLVQRSGVDSTTERYTPPVFGTTDAPGSRDAHYLPGGWQGGLSYGLTPDRRRDWRAGRMG